MNFELKHIAGYLPYGLLGYFQDEEEDTNYYTTKIDVQCIEWFMCEGIPVLRPMSDLTVEIEVNGEKFIPLVKHVESMGEHVEDFDPFFLTDYEQAVLNIMSSSEIRTQYDLEFLLEYHFDVYDLINSGSAIDINTLK